MRSLFLLGVFGLISGGVMALAFDVDFYELTAAHGAPASRVSVKS